MRRMPKILCASALLCAAFAMAPGFADDDGDTGEDSASEQVDVLFGGDYFGAGASPGPVASVDGDAFIAGGEVILNQPVQGDAALSGGSIHVGERIGSDLYAAGGDILVNARVGHNARIAGGRVHLTRHADIAGKVTIAGSRIRFDGSAGGALAAYGDSVLIDGEIGGAVAVVARNLELGPNAQIHGGLTYRTANAPQISDQAIINGGIRRSGFEFPKGELEPVVKTVVWVGVAMFTSGLFLLGVLIVLLAPNTLTAVVRELRAQPLASFLLGFALVVCLPVAAMLATLSVIGIPLGLILFFIWPVVVTLGYLVGVIFCADALASWLSRRRPAGRALRIVGLAVALIVLMLLSRVIFIGAPLILLLLFLGTGALVLAIRNSVR